MKVLIMDMTHGGAILAERFVKRGDEVTCVDVYHIATPEFKEETRKKGVGVFDQVPKDDYDVLVAPMHCPEQMFIGEATFKERMSFSRAVNLFVDKKTFRIEVTGVKGKTSTCYILAHVLSKAGKKLFLHSSRGQGPWENGHRIECLKSIAPVSILELPDEGYDCIICEVSLGGSGKADIAVITNLLEDYGIAKNSRKASMGKAEILTDKINIVKEDELNIWKAFGKHEFLTFKDNVKVEGKPAIGEGIKISFCYKGKKETATLDPSYMSLQYIPSFDIVLKICEAMDIPVKAIIDGISTFKGVPGRGEISKEGDRWYVRDRNPGISHMSIGMTLECLQRMGCLDKALAVIDPVSKKVCDKMDVDQMKAVAAKYNVPVEITDGMGSKPTIPADTKVVIEFIKEGFQ